MHLYNNGTVKDYISLDGKIQIIAFIMRLWFTGGNSVMAILNAIILFIVYY